MATIGFPANPSDGDQFTSGTTVYVYDGTKNVWKRASGVPSGATVPSSINDLGDVNLAVDPETATLDVDAQNNNWLWSWDKSDLPFARTSSTNSTHTTIPIYKQSTYQINNFANTLHSGTSETRSFRLKWLKGAGNDNLIDWPTITEVNYSNPNINEGNTILVERLVFDVPSTITLPTLTPPTVTYDVDVINAGVYTFSGVVIGNNPDIGPLYRGGTYTFNISAAGQPFYFTTDNGVGFSTGQYIGEYTSGVSGSRTETGTITFTVPNDAPSELYYQSANFQNMRGSIEVRDLAVETDADGNYVIYGQHEKEGYEQAFEILDLPGLTSQMCLVYDAVTSKWRLQDLATYAEKTISFQTKIKEITGTTSLVNADGTSFVASVEIYSTSALLPSLNNVEGDLAFIQDTQELKVWRSVNGWNVVVGGAGTSIAAPTIASVDPVSYNGDENSTFTITGTNFTLGSVVTFITSGGAEYNASTTSVVSGTTINCTTPRDFTEQDSDLSIRITNLKGEIVGLANVIQTGGAPVWTTASGTLYQNAWADDVAIGDNSYRNNMTFDETIVATDPDGQAVSYSIQSGSLPPETSLNPTTGVITGGPTGDIGGDVTYSFVAAAEDTASNIVTRPFNIIVKNIGSPLYSFSNATFTNGGVVGYEPAIYNDIATNITGTFNAVMVDEPVNFSFSSGFIRWRIPDDGTYRITVIGAAGAGDNQYSGGIGAYNRGQFSLLGGEYLHMLIGQQGTSDTSVNNGSGGGGATFVTLEDSGNPNDRAFVTPLIVAGGGGGAGRDGTYTHGNGGSASGNTSTSPGIGGNGTYSPSYGEGYTDSFQQDGKSYAGVEAGTGGFGGGGPHAAHIGGGGGGYRGGSGGTLGDNGAANGTPSSGGLSFNSGSSQVNTTAVSSELHGKITIEKIA